MYQCTLPVSNKAIIEIVKRAFNLVDRRLIGHGARVSYIVFQMVKATGLYTPKETRNLLILAALHDIGAYKTEEIDKMVEFETGDVWGHSIYGFMFFKYFTPFKDIAPAILFHHTPWNRLKTFDRTAEQSKRSAQIVNLADRFDIYLEDAGTTRNYEDFHHYLSQNCPQQYSPEVTELFNHTDFSFLFNDQNTESVDVLLESALAEEFEQLLEDVPFTEEEKHSFLRMITYAIDFRSPHTVTHTITTTILSAELGKMYFEDKSVINNIIFGAMLHDLGKIGIPTEILEYPGKLSPQAMNIMKTHVGLTGAILGDSVTPEVKELALRHHEKLDGSGYPRGLKGNVLTIPQRIIAVADIVSALTGTRSYKDSFSKEKTCMILNEMADNGLIDSAIVDIIVHNYDSLMASVYQKTAPLLAIYREMQTSYLELLEEITVYMAEHPEPQDSI